MEVKKEMIQELWTEKKVTWKMTNELPGCHKKPNMAAFCESSVCGVWPVNAWMKLQVA